MESSSTAVYSILLSTFHNLSLHANCYDSPRSIRIQVYQSFCNTTLIFSEVTTEILQLAFVFSDTSMWVTYTNITGKIELELTRHMPGRVVPPPPYEFCRKFQVPAKWRACSRGEWIILRAGNNSAIDCHNTNIQCILFLSLPNLSMLSQSVTPNCCASLRPDW